MNKKKWSDRKVWQWLIHASIGGGWAFIGASIVWLGASAPLALLVGFYAAVVGGVMKEGTDQSVSNEIRRLDVFFVRAPDIMNLQWNGWDWLDFAQHVAGGIVGALASVLLWWVAS